MLVHASILEGEEAVKRVVNGVSYNTETSTKLGECRWEEGKGVLYQTRDGAFFVDEETTFLEWNERERTEDEKVVHRLVPLSPERAKEWLLEGEVEVFHNPFEKATEAEPEATIYVRVPASLKRRVDETAEEDKMSTNAWVMRCLELCLRAKELTDPNHLREADKQAWAFRRPPKPIRRPKPRAKK
jgi:hypothetical protein